MSSHRLALSITLLCCGTAAAAEMPDGVIEEVIVVSPYGQAIARARVPAHVLVAEAADIERAQTLDLSDFLNRNLPSIHINHAQNNPLQPDLNFRGFTASPLLGLPQGMAVYQNGVRMNEPFGDTVNWDLIPLSAIDRVELLAGAHPVFGPNTLGGALSVRTKNGFTYQGTGAEAYAGSFERRVAALQHGDNNGHWGYYLNGDYFEEDGWRDFSPSDAKRFFATVSWRGTAGSADLSIGHARSDLYGNGAAPAELLTIDRQQVFTHPDITENRQTQVALEGTINVSPSLKLAGHAYYRKLDTDSFNGDGTVFEECDFDDEEFLVEEDFDDEDGDGNCTFGIDSDIVVVRDSAGNPIEAELDEELNAINNISRRQQDTYGVSLQLALGHDLAVNRRNDFMAGASVGRGDADFNSRVEVARLLENRSTSRTDILADSLHTDVNSRVTTMSLFFSDSLDVSERTTVTLSGRYDRTEIELQDRSEQNPELNGRHRFNSFNPSLGVTFRPLRQLTLYANASQSARAPTPVELACAEEDAPCNLPNAFLADPPLDEVVARSFELGGRGNIGSLQWHVGAFQTTNEDDILFQTVGGPQANVGFFDNVSDTRRAGLEVAATQMIGAWRWFLQYSFVKATFRDEFIVNSPNHPWAEDVTSELVIGDDKLRVRRGSTIPGIPRHQANVGFDVRPTAKLSLGADVSYRSGAYLRGDEINVLGKTTSYAVVNLRGEFQVTEQFALFARVDNLFDKDYVTFGLLGEPDEVFEDFADPRFFGAGPPRAAWAGFRISL